MTFQLGEVVATPGALETFDGNALAVCLLRHSIGDWGNVCAEDAQLNDLALADGSRLLSSYELPQGKLWIITEWDRSVTTFLLPEEY